MSNMSRRHDHFIRQRRNLIATSLLVTLYEAADFTFTEINFLGNKAKIGNPEIVSLALVVALLYFLWRYYTAYRESGDGRAFSNACIGWAEKASKSYIKRKYSSIQRELSVDLIRREGITLTYVLRGVYDPASDSIEKEKISLKWRYLVYRIFAVIPITLYTSYFTEYVLPYLLAGFAIAEVSGVGITNLLINFSLF